MKMILKRTKCLYKPCLSSYTEALNLVKQEEKFCKIESDTVTSTTKSSKTTTKRYKRGI